MFYVNENMSDFLLFEYWQTVGRPGPGLSLPHICLHLHSVWFGTFGVLAPKNDKCVGFWLKLRLQLAYFSFNQQANKCQLLWFYVGVPFPKGAWHIGGRLHYFTAMDMGMGMTFAGSRCLVACLPIIDNLIWPKCLGGGDK